MGDKKKKDGCSILFLIILILILWGMPSLLSGEGFFNGIDSNFRAIPYVLGTLIAAYLLFKFMDNKN